MNSLSRFAAPGDDSMTTAFLLAGTQLSKWSGIQRLAGGVASANGDVLSQVQGDWLSVVFAAPQFRKVLGENLGVFRRKL